MRALSAVNWLAGLSKTTKARTVSTQTLAKNRNISCTRASRDSFNCTSWTGGGRKWDGRRRCRMSTWAACLLLAIALAQLAPTTTAFYLRSPSASVAQSSDVLGLNTINLLRRILERLTQAPTAHQYAANLPPLPAVPSSALDGKRRFAGKRGHTTCINECMTGGMMTLVRCKQMCH